MTDSSADAADVLLGLLAPATVGDALSEGITLLRASLEIGLSFVCEAGGTEVIVQVSPPDAEQPFATRSRHFAFSYRAGDAPLADGVGFRVCKVVADLAQQNEVAVVSALRELAEEMAAEKRVRRTRVKTLLEPVQRGHERYYTLSPYVGCLIGCTFCYAQSHVGAWRALVGLPEVPWGSYVEVRENAPQVLAEELARLEPRPIKFCPIVSDPYQVVEKTHRLTRQCLQVIADDGRFPVLVLTRGTEVRADLELLGGMKAHVGVSIPTIDDDVRRHFEPRGAPIANRLSILRELREAGARTMAVVQPLLPGDETELADALAARVSSVRIDVLHGVVGAGTEFSNPRYAEAAGDEWQRQRAQSLAAALVERGVAVWPNELPPDLLSARS